MTSESPNLNPPGFEPCPTPLAWHDVAQSFHESATSRIFETPLAELKVTEFGTGHPIFFLPPLYGSSRLFCLTAWLLKEEYRSVFLETPRFYQSPSPEKLVSETAQVLSLGIEHLSPRGADLYASGFSGQAAIQLMARWPHLIRSVFFQGVWGCRQFNAVEKLLLQLGRIPPVRLKKLPFWQTTQIENHRRWFPPFDETRFGFLLQEAGETRTCDFARRMLAASRTDVRPLLRDIQQPVAILHCEGEGRQLAASGAEMEATLPHVIREEMPHSGQFPYLTHPHRLIKILKPFWQSVAQ